MRPIRTVLIFIGVVFVLGALLAPWLYWGVRSAATSWPALEGITRRPFHSYVNRSLLGLALIGLWPLPRFLKIPSWSEWGFRSSPEARGRFAGGLAFGFASLGVVAFRALVRGARRWNSELSLSALGGK